MYRLLCGFLNNTILGLLFVSVLRPTRINHLLLVLYIGFIPHTLSKKVCRVMIAYINIVAGVMICLRTSKHRTVARSSLAYIMTDEIRLLKKFSRH